MYVTLVLNTDSFGQKMAKSRQNFIETVRSENRYAAEVKSSTFQKSRNKSWFHIPLRKKDNEPEAKGKWVPEQISINLPF